MYCIVSKVNERKPAWKKSPNQVPVLYCTVLRTKDEDEEKKKKTTDVDIVYILVLHAYYT